MSSYQRLPLLQINVPATIMYAAGASKEGAFNPCRKPQTGMWDHFVEHLNGGVVPGGRVSHMGRARLLREAVWRYRVDQIGPGVQFCTVKSPTAAGISLGFSARVAQYCTEQVCAVCADKAQCFFVGDMAGRAGDKGKNPSSDR